MRKLLHANALRLRFFRRKAAPLSEAFEDSKKNPAEPDTQTKTGEEPAEQKGMVSMKKILTVDGMMCAHCQMHVQKALAAVDGVQEAAVDLEKKQATVTLTKEVPDHVLMEAVKEAGYTPVSCSVE